MRCARRRWGAQPERIFQASTAANLRLLGTATKETLYDIIPGEYDIQVPHHSACITPRFLWCGSRRAFGNVLHLKKTAPPTCFLSMPV